MGLLNSTKELVDVLNFSSIYKLSQRLEGKHTSVNNHKMGQTSGMEEI